MKKPRMRAIIVIIGLLLPLLWASPSRAETVEERRRTRLIAHLKRLNRPEDWLLVRKLFSTDRERQVSALQICPFAEDEWPWHLSSGHLESYTFTVDFIPVNMDADPEEETLIVLQSDPEDVHYLTFCLVDDAKRGRSPLASYTESSRGRPITYQITDITADGNSEIILYTRDGSPEAYSDSVRIIKANGKRGFELVWFGRLRDQLSWPAVKIAGGRGGAVARSELLRAKMRLHLNGPKSPADIVLRGVREFRETLTDSNGVRQVKERSVDKVPFVEHWRWDKARFQYVRSSFYE